MGTHIRVLGESFPMNTNMTGFRWFSKIYPSNAEATFVQSTRMQRFLKT